MENDNKDLLATLNKIAAWADYQKKMAKWSLIGVIPFLMILFGGAIYLESYFKKSTADISPPGGVSHEWYDVSRAERKGDYEKALYIANELLERTPLDFDGHYRVGEILLKLGDKERAIISFKRAEEIFPIPRHRNAIEALSK